MEINCLKQFFVSLKRCTHSRGFGVQSPNDYRYICDVINERLPYYAYELLRNRYPKLSSINRKISELYFRVVNALQPQTIIDYHPINEIFRTYMQAGCKKANIIVLSTLSELSEENCIEFLRISINDVSDSIIRTLFSKVFDSTIIVIEDIHWDKSTLRQWKKIITNKKVTISFDLYYCGIIFFDNQRYKQNYIVNF